MASEDVGRTLSQVMIDRGFTASSLARESMLNINTIYRIRDGRTADPADWVKERLCGALGCPECDIEWGEKPALKDHVREREERRLEHLTMKMLLADLGATYAQPITYEIGQSQLAIARKITARLKDWHRRKYVENEFGTLPPDDAPEDNGGFTPAQIAMLERERLEYDAEKARLKAAGLPTD